MPEARWLVRGGLLAFVEPRLHLFQLARHGQRAGAAGGVPAGDGGAVFEHVEHIGADAVAQALKRVKRQGLTSSALQWVE